MVFRYVGTKTFASSPKSQDFWPKKAKFSPKYVFLVILGRRLAFLAHFVPCPTKTQCEKGAQVVFSYVGTKTFAFSSKNQDFLPKNYQFGPKLAYLVVLSHHLVPCWWAGWWLWHTGCISQDTYLLYHLSNSSHMKCSLNFRYRLLGVWLPVYKISFSFLIAFLCYL